DLAENVRVTAHHFFMKPVDNVRQVKLALLLRDLRVKDDLEQEIAELFLELLRIGRVQSIEGLKGLLDEHGLEGLTRLLLVPWAAVLPSQPFDQVHQLLNVRSLSQLPYSFDAPESRR